MNVTDPIRDHASNAPDAVAVIDSRRGAVGYRAFDRTIDAVARRFAAHDIGPGDFVVVPPIDEYASLLIRLALARIGAAAAPRGLSPSRTKAVVASAGGDGPFHPVGIHVDPGWFDEAPGDVAPAVVSTDGAAVMGVFASSGTTGRARLIPVTHDMMAARVRATDAGVPMPSRPRQVTVPTAGSGFGLLARLRVLWAGGTIVTAPARPEGIVDVARRHRVDRLVMLPFWITHLVAALPPGDRPLPSLAQLEFGGSELPDPALELARARLCDEIWNVYGVTEGGYVATGRIGTFDRASSEAGYAVPGVEVRAFGPDGAALEPGLEGRLRMRGAGFVTAYLDDPERSASSFHDGWFEPGDTGSVAADGMVRVHGRDGDVINAGGYKVHPRAVEQVLSSLDWIRDVAVFGLPGEEGITRIAAAIVPARRIDRRDVDALRARSETMPSVMMVVRELPRNENGKVRRDQLVAMAIEHRGTATEV